MYHLKEMMSIVFIRLMLLNAEVVIMQQFLRQNGVEALVHYKTPFDQPAANYLGNNAKQFLVTAYCDSILSLAYPS